MTLATFDRPAAIAITGTYPTLACALFAWARAAASAAGAPWPTALLAVLDARIGDPLDPVEAERVPAAFAAANAEAMESADGWTWTVPDTSALAAAVEARTFCGGEGIVWGTGESRVRLHRGDCGRWLVTISGPVGSAAASRAESVNWPDEQVAILRSGVIPAGHGRGPVFGAAGVGRYADDESCGRYTDDESCEA